MMMKEKLSEMILVVRPTKGDGLIPIDELETILKQIGYDFLVSEKDEIARTLDESNDGYFH